jgi:hypothetical protein
LDGYRIPQLGRTYFYFWTQALHADVTTQRTAYIQYAFSAMCWQQVVIVKQARKNMLQAVLRASQMLLDTNLALSFVCNPGSKNIKEGKRPTVHIINTY